MKLRKPQVLDVSLSSAFYYSLWQQKPLAEFYLLSDTNCSGSAQTYFNIEAYNHSRITDNQHFLFFYPMMKWMHYSDSSTYVYPGTLTTNIDSSNTIYVPRALTAVQNADYDAMKLDLQAATTLAIQNDLKTGTTADLMTLESKMIVKNATSRFYVEQRVPTIRYEMAGIGDKIISFIVGGERAQIDESGRLVCPSRGFVGYVVVS